MKHQPKSARWLAISAQLLAVLMLVSNLILWSLPSFTEAMAYQYSGLSNATPITLNWITTLAGIVVSSLYLGLLAYSLFTIAGIFRLIARGNWFETTLSKRMKRFGLSLLLFGLSSPLIHTVMTLVVTAFNPPGQRMLSIGVGSSDYIIILIGFLMMMLGHVMQEAEILAKENREII